MDSVLPRLKYGVVQCSINIVRQQRHDSRLIRQRGVKTPRPSAIHHRRSLGIGYLSHFLGYFAALSLPCRPGGITNPIGRKRLPSRPCHGSPWLSAIVHQCHGVFHPSRLQKHEARSKQPCIIHFIIGCEERRHIYRRGRPAAKSRLERCIGVKHSRRRAIALLLQCCHRSRPHGTSPRRRKNGIIIPLIFIIQCFFKLASVTSLDPTQCCIQPLEREGGISVISPETGVQYIGRCAFYHGGRII
mmetsp:Transcript_27441/g.47560  ORF Transcript_27441/g.47560 Transcript_27441/m.47560 type:complete len:245 (+) Transcript_27441:1870-2604(+)